MKRYNCGNETHPKNCKGSGNGHIYCTSDRGPTKKEINAAKDKLIWDLVKTA